MDILALLMAFGLVVLNAFFVATEFAIVKVRPTRIEELIRKQHRGAHAVRRILGHIDAYLSATQMGVTLASLGLGWIGEPAFSRLLERPLTHLGVYDPVWKERIGLAIAFTLISLMHIVVGELIPKSIAIRRAEAVALAVAWPMQIFYALFYPAIRTFNGISNQLMKLTGIKRLSVDEQHSEEEIKIILNQARSAGLLSASRSDLLRKVLSLPTKNARHLMVPRNEAIFLDLNLSLEDNLTRAMESGLTRFPLCVRELDEVIGVVDIRDMLYRIRQGPVQLRELARPVSYFPEVMSAERLLAEFRQRHATMAIVVDEYGGASGIITPADVVAAVMGELDEEDDNEVVALPGGAYDVDGIAPLEEVEEVLKVVFRGHHARTIAGFLMERLGRMPRPGDRVVECGYALTIMDVDGPRLRRVRIQRDHADTGTVGLPASPQPLAKESRS